MVLEDNGKVTVQMVLIRAAIVDHGIELMLFVVKNRNCLNFIPKRNI